MGKQEKKARKLLERAVVLEKHGKYNQAIYCVEKAVELSGGSEILNWIARYNYQIFQILYDKTIVFNRAYRELIRLRREALESDCILHDEDAVWVYLRLQFFLVMLRYKECEQVSEYEEIARGFQRLVEVYQIEEADGADYFICSNLALGNCYLSKGNALAAIRYFEKILDRVDENGEIPTLTFFSLVSLGFAYLNRGDSAKAKKLCNFLYNKIYQGMVFEPLQEDLQRFVILYANAYIAGQVYHRAWEVVSECLAKGLIYHISVDDYMWTIYEILFELSKWTGNQIDRSNLKKMQEIVREMEESGNLEKIPRSDRAGFYYEKSILYDWLGDNEKAEKSMGQAADQYLAFHVSESERGAYFSFMQQAMQFFSMHSNEGMVMRCATHIMEQLPKLYSGAEYYLDNVQMEEYVAVCNGLFYLGYSYLSWHYRTDGENASLFEYSANYKNILLSVVRERVRKIYLDKYNAPLIQEMNQCRDRLASFQNGKIKGDYIQVAKLLEELKELEAEFASRHEKNEEMPFFSFERIMTVLPNNTALIDIIDFEQDAWKKGRDRQGLGKESERYLDIFILVKKGTVIYRHTCVKDTNILYRQAALLKEKIMSPHAKFTKEAKSICETLFAPFKELLFSVSDIILSPHGELYNLPVELVFESTWEQMRGKRYVYCQSVRDLFEYEDGISKSHADACIIGSPLYSLADEMQGSDEVKGRLFDIEQISSLPYSEYEAKSIAKLLGTSCMTGREATKFQIKQSCSNIHIATHGLIQQIGERNVWYNSALAFAGVADWYNTGKEMEGLGNGLLTAEEISRMNLDTVNLAVLSACNSGTSSFTLYEQQSGLHLAFGVAGVKYVISALWNVDDLATAVLMKLFYQSLLKLGNVPEALVMAKEQLKNMTVKKLCTLLDDDRGILTETLCNRIFGYLSKIPENTMIFRSPRYYAAFICYQYKY